VPVLQCLGRLAPHKDPSLPKWDGDDQRGLCNDLPEGPLAHPLIVEGMFALGALASAAHARTTQPLGKFLSIGGHPRLREILIA
jgi:hypothetical protein